MPVILTKQKIQLSTCTYYNVTHSNYWEFQVNTYWNGSFWLNEFTTTASLSAYSGFSSGYRPSKARITFTRDLYDDSIRFRAYDTNNGLLGDTGMNSYPSGGEQYVVEFNLTYTTFDFLQIHITSNVIPFDSQINLIELCSASPPASPPFGGEGV